MNKIISIIIFVILLSTCITVVADDDLQYESAYETQEGENWWNTNWTYRKLITLNSSQTPSTQLNFPVLINITDSNLSSFAQSDGDDIVFILYSDNTTQLNHEIEQYTTAGRLTSWVNVTSLSHTTDTKMWMYYNNSGCGNQEHVTDTWDSNYAIVLHFDGTSATCINDSTSNYNNATSDQGDPTYNITGKFGKAMNPDINDAVLIPSSVSLNFTDNYTIETYYKADVAVWEGTGTHNLFDKTISASPKYILCQWADTQNKWYSYNDNVGTYWVVSNVFVPSSNWNHMAIRMVEESTNSKIYYDGTWDNNVENSASAITTDVPLRIGNNENYDGGMRADIEEFRLSEGLRSEDYIVTSYNTMNNCSVDVANSFIVSIGSQEISSQASTYDTYSTLTFGGKSSFDSAPSQLPVFSYPVPTNGSTNIPITTDSWNITIEDPEGDTFNWTIQGSQNIGINASNTCANGSYNISINTSNLSYSTTYTVWVNATDGNWTNETFIFTTEDEPLPTTYRTLTFGGKAGIQDSYPIISNVGPTNGSSDILLYPWLNVTVTDPEGFSMNVTWLYNIGSGWTEFAYNTTTSGSTVRQKATFANNSQTTYNWSVHVNDTEPKWKNATYNFITYEYTWSDWSDWWQFNYTAEAPTNLIASTYAENETNINLTWDNPTNGGWDTTVLVVNASTHTGYPSNASNGTIIYNGTNESYNHTDLSADTTFFYRIWSWNETNAEFSANNDSTTGVTGGGPSPETTICCPFPTNTSTSVTRPPTNLSARVNGTIIDVYIHFWNLTPKTDNWTLLYNWSNDGIGYYSANELTTNNATTQFIWGNTEYTWSMNATDGSSWENRTFTYTTLSTASGADARDDVNNDNTVDVFDLNTDWSNRDGLTTYDGLYDVNSDKSIDVFDLNTIWSNRS